MKIVYTIVVTRWIPGASGGNHRGTQYEQFIFRKTGGGNLADIHGVQPELWNRSARGIGARTAVYGQDPGVA